MFGAVQRSWLSVRQTLDTVAPPRASQHVSRTEDTEDTGSCDITGPVSCKAFLRIQPTSVLVTQRCGCFAPENRDDRLLKNSTGQPEGFLDTVSFELALQTCEERCKNSEKLPTKV